jgi:hypothetical protein
MHHLHPLRYIHTSLPPCSRDVLYGRSAPSRQAHRACRFRVPLACLCLGKSGTWFSSSLESKPSLTHRHRHRHLHLSPGLCCGEGVPHIFNSLQPGRSFGILPLDPSVLARPTEANAHICRTHSQPRRVSMTDTSTLETCCARLLRCTSQKHNYLHTVPYSPLHIRSELIGNDKLNLISY